MALSKLAVIKIYQQKTALVIDDYPDMRGTVRRMLDNFGFMKVDTAPNGEEAIARCEENSYDLILADYNLGDGKNGQQVLEELRYKRLIKNTSLYMMITAETTKSMVFGALEYQPDDYLTKPFTQSVLQKRLDRLILEKQALYAINNAIDKQDYDHAIELCRQKIDQHDRYEQRCYRIMSGCMYKKQQFPEAKQVYENILEERELNWASIGLGKTLIELSDFKAAEKIFSKLIDEGCLCLEIYDCLADVKLRLGDSDEAQRLLEQAIDISPNAIMRQETLADICEDNHDWDRAEISRKKVIKLANNSVYDSPEHYLKFARCLNSSINHKKDPLKTKQAAEILQRAKRKYKGHENLSLHSDIIQASVQASSGDLEKTQPVVENLQKRLASATNKSAQLMLDMAQTYKSIGDHEQANLLLKQLAEKYESNPEVGEAIDRLSDEPLSKQGKLKAIALNQEGKELFANKKYSHAIQLFGQALKHYPNNIGLNLNMMLALVKEMASKGPTESQLERCTEAKIKLSHLDKSNPMFDRYRALCGHLEKLNAHKN